MPQHVEREALEHRWSVVALVAIVLDRSVDCAHPYPVAEAIGHPLVAFDCRKDESCSDSARQQLLVEQLDLKLGQVDTVLPTALCKCGRDGQRARSEIEHFVGDVEPDVLTSPDLSRDEYQPRAPETTRLARIDQPRSGRVPDAAGSRFGQARPGDALHERRAPPLRTGRALRTRERGESARARGTT